MEQLQTLLMLFAAGFLPAMGVLLALKLMKPQFPVLTLETKGEVGAYVVHDVKHKSDDDDDEDDDEDPEEDDSVRLGSNLRTYTSLKRN